MKRKMLLVTLLLVALLSQTLVAGATEWSVWYNPSAPSNTNHTSDTEGYYTDNATRIFRESCDSYNVTMESNGNVPHVEYFCYWVEADGDVHTPACGTHYHYSTQNAHDITMNAIAPADSTLYGVYRITVTSTTLQTSISGSVGE